MMIKRLIATALVCLLAIPAFANTKISQMPSGGDTATADVVPVVRAGVNLKTTFPSPGAAPAGPAGAFQTYATATSFLGLTPSAALTAISSGIFVDPRDPQFGSNTCTGYYGINASALVSGGSGYAVNDTFTVASPWFGANQATGHVTGISGGGTVTSYVIDTAGGAYNQKVGQTLATVATSGGGSALTISITSALTTGNNDTAALHAAGVYAASVGGALLVPNGCWVANLIVPSGLTMVGQGMGTAYAFSGNSTGAALPKLFAIGSPTYVVNMNGGFDQAFIGFSIDAFASGASPPTVCLGGDADTGGFNGSKDWILSMRMTGCNISLGQQASATGHLLLVVAHSDLGATNGGAEAGASGNFSDTVFYDNTFAGDSSGTGIICGGSCYGGLRIYGNRFEFQKRGIDMTSADGSTISGNQFDHHRECQIRVTNGAGSGIYSDNQFAAGGLGGSLFVTNAINNGSGLIRLTVNGNVGSIGGSVTSSVVTGDIAYVANVGGISAATGTWSVTVIDGTHVDLQGSTFSGTYTSGGTASIKGKDSAICLQNPLSNPGYGSDNSFVNNSFMYSSSGSYTHYGLEVTTTGSFQDNVSFIGGFAEIPPFPYSGLQIGLAHWTNGVAPHYIQWGVSGQEALITDPTATGYSVNSIGALGLLTSSPTAGTIFDALSATATTNSSIGLPGGTSAARPTTGVEGMLRYNSDIPGVEAYYSGTWNTFGSLAGVGTVTSLSVTTTNGISGTVANPTTTPAISLSLGNITPLTVNGLTLSATTTGALSSNGTGVITSGTLGNTYLTNSSVTVSPGTGLSGGGSVALGSTITVSALQASTTVEGSSIVGSGLSISSTGVLSVTSTGLSTSFSALTAATVSNTIDNLNFPNTWNWTTLTSGNALTLTATASASGAVLKASGNVVLGLGPLTTSATDGFVYIPLSAGTPIGVPSIQVGYVPMEFDTTNNRLYVYNSGWSNVGTSLSSIVAATSTNSFDNTNLAQTWAWGTLSTQTALTLSTSSLTTGKLLALSNTSTKSSDAVIHVLNQTTSTGYGVYSSLTGTGNTGYSGYFSNSATTTGYALYIDGAMGFANTTTGIVTTNGVGEAIVSSTVPNSFLTAPDSTKTSNYTIASTEMSGQVNYNGSSIVATIPAISSSVLSSGQSVLITNYNSSTLGISSTPTINGLPATTSLHRYGWNSYLSNGTTLDAFGFPGFGTITTNALTKFVDATGAITASGFSDNGTTISTSENITTTGIVTAAAGRSTLQTISISTATFTPNFDTGGDFSITLDHTACPCTLANPSTTPVAGQHGVIYIKQSASGSDTIGTWGSKYYYGGGVASIALSTGTNAIDVFSYTVEDSSTIILTLGASNITH